MSSWAEVLAPSLAQEAPVIARAVPWLAVTSAAMMVGAIVASHYIFALAESSRRGDMEARRGRELKARDCRQFERRLARVRRNLLAGVVIVGLVWIALSSTGRGTPASDEFFMWIIGVNMLLPAYFVVRVLQLTFGRIAERIEDIDGHTQP